MSGTAWLLVALVAAWLLRRQIRAWLRWLLPIGLLLLVIGLVVTGDAQRFLDQIG